jgi:hypothetical protein
MHSVNIHRLVLYKSYGVNVNISLCDSLSVHSYFDEYRLFQFPNDAILP